VADKHQLTEEQGKGCLALLAVAFFLAGAVFLDRGMHATAAAFGLVVAYLRFCMWKAGRKKPDASL